MASAVDSARACLGSDGSLLFVQHMISKMKRPRTGGSRLAIVFNGSPLFTGGAGSGESEIRRWIIENDWLEAIVALPDQMFYNTGIPPTSGSSPTARPAATRQGAAGRRPRVRHQDAQEPGRQAQGDSGSAIGEIVRLYGEFPEDDQVKILPNEDFGFLRITVERPLRLRWTATTGTLAAYDENPKLARLLTAECRSSLRAELAAWGEEFRTDRKVAVKRVRDAVRQAGAPRRPSPSRRPCWMCLRFATPTPIR